MFVCPKCGWIVDRDYNASFNILHRSGSERPLVPVELCLLPLARWGYEAGSPVR
ncbi:OrfB transposase, IS605 family [Saccharolobus solfataricus]|uniref:OrfB transposase, IS605 family n=1 Tax=Saccharolobus solfataricus TaxID=2287 RepID=A0A157T1U2_SACSO|nr:zinc ribbon domain-containing protein [Saccharolobus solfataricus]SAI85374.1 OrfB transposase, IS605 family [Saccharolobus solfataricus]